MTQYIMMEARHFETMVQFGPLSFQVTEVQAYLMMIINDSERYGFSGQWRMFSRIIISETNASLPSKPIPQ